MGIDQHLVHEGFHEFSIVLSPVKIGCFGGAIDHGVPGWIGPFPGLDVIPMLNGEVALETEDFEANA
ncbi:MAG TPA: hypothetical protein DCR55_09540 [Lentisphaeria bacterium]|nr:hypothetical protein [Lentisphaeria bacterium]